MACRNWVLVLLAQGLFVASCGGAAPPLVGGSGGASGGSSGDASATGGAGGAGGGGGAGGDEMDAPEAEGGDDGATGGEDGGVVTDAGCNIVVEKHDDEGAAHLELCVPTSYRTNPPSSGNHYGTWPAYRTYARPVPWGFLVHGLEHGAVVISYRCPAGAGPAGCNVDVSAVQAFIDGLAADNVCLSRKLIVLQPDPNLDVAFAASAWTWTLRADCFDAAAFGQFIDDHYGHGLERVCSQGADLSATNWCP